MLQKIIPTGLVSQLQMEENLFMAVRTIEASFPTAAAASKAATAHCIIVSYCQMMAMARTAFSLLLPAVKSQILLEIRGKKYENASGRKSKWWKVRNPMLQMGGGPSCVCEVG